MPKKSVELTGLKARLMPTGDIMVFSNDVSLKGKDGFAMTVRRGTPQYRSLLNEIYGDESDRMGGSAEWWEEFPHFSPFSIPLGSSKENAFLWDLTKDAHKEIWSDEKVNDCFSPHILVDYKDSRVAANLFTEIISQALIFPNDLEVTVVDPERIIDRNLSKSGVVEFWDLGPALLDYHNKMLHRYSELEKLSYNNWNGKRNILLLVSASSHPELLEGDFSVSMSDLSPMEPVMLERILRMGRPAGIHVAIGSKDGVRVLNSESLQGAFHEVILEGYTKARFKYMGNDYGAFTPYQALGNRKQLEKMAIDLKD